MNKAIALIVAGVLLYIVASVFSPVTAEEYSASGNAAGSKNNINVSDTSSKTLQQSNQADITNIGGASANTGGNTGSANTGDATSLFQLNNQFNNNQAQSDCCPTETPKPTAKPTSPAATATQPAESPTPKPTTPPGQPTATNAPQGDGEGNKNGDGHGNGGIGGGGQAEIIGLSNTASIDWKRITQILGIICIATGSMLLKGKSSVNA